MKVKKEIVLLMIVFLIGLIFRFYRLGSFLPIFNDEAAVGYNAWSILKTGKDEFGVKLPIFFKSFGEGKLPVYVYQAVIPVSIFGLNTFSTRFIPALLGSLSVLIIFLWVKELLLWSKIKDRFLINGLPVLSAFFMATMPWHIHFSRGVFGQDSLFWVLLGSYFSLKFLNKKNINDWLISLLFFSISLMSYHAAKAFVPLWIGFILISLLKNNAKKILFPSILALIISGSVWLIMSNSELGKARAKDMSVFSVHSGVYAKLFEAIVTTGNQPVLLTRFIHNKFEAYGRDILKRYFSHFEMGFLVFEGDLLRDRYRIPYNGQLLFISLPLYLVGIYLMVKMKLWGLIVFLLLSPIAASLSFETPSSVRAIYMTAPISIILAIGFIKIFEWLKSIRSRLGFFLGFGLIGILFFYSLIKYLNGYWIHHKLFFSHDWQYGMQEIVEDISAYKDNYEEIVVTENTGTPYIFFLFFNRYDPIKWQEQANKHIVPDQNFSFISIKKMDNISFIEDLCVDKLESNKLYLCKSGYEPSGFKTIKEYYWANGEKSFIMGEKEI